MPCVCGSKSKYDCGCSEDSFCAWKEPKCEEKMYTITQIIDALHKLNDEEFNELKMRHEHGREKGIAIQKWFETNVK